MKSNDDNNNHRHNKQNSLNLSFYETPVFGLLLQKA